MFSFLFSFFPILFPQYFRFDISYTFDPLLYFRSLPLMSGILKTSASTLCDCSLSSYSCLLTVNALGSQGPLLPLFSCVGQFWSLFEPGFPHKGDTTGCCSLGKSWLHGWLAFHSGASWIVVWFVRLMLDLAWVYGQAGRSSSSVSSSAIGPRAGVAIATL